jgi:ABC-2 type transport system ATP-binding protein
MATTSGAEFAVEARGVVHRYGQRRALDGLSLQVPRGSVFGLLGPNGSGKSTFITMLAAMESPRSGELRVFGEAPSRALRARAGTVFQENAQDPLMPAAEYLGLAARLFAVRDAHTRIASLLEQFGLAGRAKDTIASLSGGMRRRLEMVRALLHDPELVLLDEPTTGVDPGERRALWDGLLRENRERTILLATNDLAEAEQVCDDVAFLREGKVLASGSPAAMKRGLLRDSVRIRWADATPRDLEELARWEGCGEVSLEGETVRLTVADASSFVPRLFALADGAIRAVSVEPATLEDAYFRIVGSRAPAAPGGGRR